MRTIDLNADMGEASGVAGADGDEALFLHVTSVHVAGGVVVTFGSCSPDTLSGLGPGRG